MIYLELRFLSAKKRKSCIAGRYLIKNVLSLLINFKKNKKLSVKFSVINGNLFVYFGNLRKLYAVDAHNLVVNFQSYIFWHGFLYEFASFG